MGTTELTMVGAVESAGPDSDAPAGGVLAVLGAEEQSDGVEPRSAGAVAARNQRGMVSAEWAVGIIAAVALAGVLIAVITNGPVQDALLKFVLQVIHSFSGYVR
jgi:hypothetical protein